MLAFAFPFGAVLHIVWQIAGTAILGGLVGVVGSLLKKLHIDIRDSQKEALVNVIDQAIHYVQEQSAKGISLTPKQKLAMAAVFVQQQAKDAVANISPEQLNALIEAVLAQMGKGATQKK